MAKLKIDFKAKGQLILDYFKEKGEKVGLGICLAIMVLFGGLGLWGSISAPSPAKNAEEMKKLADTKSQSFRNAEPGESDNPGPENSSTKLAALDKLDPSAYRGRQMFSESEFIDVKRRPPVILTIDDAKVSLARVAVKSYMFTKDGKGLTVLKGAASPTGGAAAVGMPPMGGNPATTPQKAQNIKLFTAKKNLPKATSEGNKYSDRLIAYLKNMEFSGRKAFPTETVTAEDFEKMKGSSRPAEQALPLRMAIVNASFPYKAQLEEFRNKLKLGSFGEVLGDSTASPEDQNVGVNAFRFLGMNVERRKKKPDGNWDDWKPLDIRGNYLPYATSTDFRFEPEDPSIADFIVNGLMMPKLKAFDPDHYPKADDAELSLAKIKSQVDESARKDKEKLKQSKPRTKQDTFDVFSPAAVGTGTTTGEAGMTPPAFNPVGTVGAGGFVPGAPAMVPGLAPGQDVEPAIHNLVRFIDVDIQPGETYEYRVQIRMGNPNYKRTKDVASPTYADGAELVSEWSKVPIVVTLPEEQSCYLVDQRKEDDKSFKGLTSEDSKRQVPMQIHKWFQNTGAETQNLSVGDWAVAERVSVLRGEFIGRKIIAKIPLWIYFFEGFGLLPPKIVKGGGPATAKTGDGIMVDFSPDRKDRPDFLLVDFEGPEYTHERVKSAGPDAKPIVTKVEDRDRIVEAYIINPLGQLEVHNIVSDRENANRKSMLQGYRERVKKAEDFMRGGGAAGTTPFGS